MTGSFEYRPVDWVTAGAVGEPGRRAFYIQARSSGDLVSLLVEKDQVRMLARLAQELLGRVDVTVTPDDLDTAGQRLREPVEPLWRAGAMSLGMDPDGRQFVLEAEELVGDDAREPAVARFWMDQSQLVALAAYAAYAVEAGARERCRLCGRPIDPVDGHVCPATNGHGQLTI
ncbi:MAG TPA: DUF3090 family protein [Euzebyales bacterium]|nr:DUF3090 family protein [Euzebyales bacterium]